MLLTIKIDNNQEGFCCKGKLSVPCANKSVYPISLPKTKIVHFTKGYSPMEMFHHDKYSHVDKEKAITWSESIVGMTPPSKKNMCNKVKISFIHD